MNEKLELQQQDLHVFSLQYNSQATDRQISRSLQLNVPTLPGASKSPLLYNSTTRRRHHVSMRTHLLVITLTVRL